MSIKLIIAGGDSFTAGDEVAADIIVPGYTSHTRPVQFPLSNSKKMMELRKKFNNELLRLGSEVKAMYRKQCLSLAWPAYLEKLTGIPVINVADFGISNHEIVHRIITRYLEYLKQYKPEEILVLMMLSSPARIGFPKSNIIEPDFEIARYHSGMINHEETRPKNLINTEWFKTHNDWDMLWSSFAQINGLITFMNKKGSNINLYTSGLWEMFVDADREIDKPVQEVAHMLDIKLDMGKIFIKNNLDCVLAAHHPSKDGHELFAQNVYNCIREFF